MIKSNIEVFTINNEGKLNLIEIISEVAEIKYYDHRIEYVKNGEKHSYVYSSHAFFKISPSHENIC